MRTVPTGRDGDFTTADAAANLSFEALFAADRDRVQGELNRLLDDMLADLHRAMRRAERASAALCDRLAVEDYAGARECSAEFRAAMADVQTFMREAYGEVRRTVRISASDHLHSLQMEDICNRRVATARDEATTVAVAIVGIVLFVGIVLVFAWSR